MITTSAEQARKESIAKPSIVTTEAIVITGGSIDGSTKPLDSSVTQLKATIDITESKAVTVDETKLNEKESQLKEPIKVTTRAKSLKDLSQKRSLSIERKQLMETEGPLTIDEPKVDTLVPADVDSIPVTSVQVVETKSEEKTIPLEITESKEAQAIKAISPSAALLVSDVIPSQETQQLTEIQTKPGSASIEIISSTIPESRVDLTCETELPKSFEKPKKSKVTVKSTVKTERSLIVQSEVFRWSQNIGSFFSTEQTATISDSSVPETATKLLADSPSMALTISSVEIGESEKVVQLTDIQDKQPNVTLTESQAIEVTSSIPGDTESKLIPTIKPEKQKLKKKVDLKKQKSLTIESKETIESVERIDKPDQSRQEQAKETICPMSSISVSSMETVEQPESLVQEAIPIGSQLVESIIEKRPNQAIGIENVDTGNLEIPLTIDRPSVEVARVEIPTSIAIEGSMSSSLEPRPSETDVHQMKSQKGFSSVEITSRSAITMSSNQTLEATIGADIEQTPSVISESTTVNSEKKSISISSIETLETTNSVPISEASSLPNVDFIEARAVSIVESIPGETELVYIQPKAPERKKGKQKVDLKKQRTLSIEKLELVETANESVQEKTTSDSAKSTLIPDKSSVIVDQVQPVDQVEILQLTSPTVRTTISVLSDQSHLPMTVSMETPVDSESQLDLPVIEKGKSDISITTLDAIQGSQQTIGDKEGEIETPQPSTASATTKTIDTNKVTVSIENKETLEKEGQFEVPKPRREKLTKKTSITKQRSISIERPVIMEMETPTEVQPEIRVTPKDTVVESPSTYSTTISQQSTYEAETIFDGVEVKPRIADQSIESIGQAISVVTSDVSQDEVPLETPQETLQSASIGLPTMTIAESRVDQLVEKEGDMIIDEETSKPKTKRSAKPPIKSKQSLIVAQKDTFEKESDFDSVPSETANTQIDLSPNVAVSVQSTQPIETDERITDSRVEEVQPKVDFTPSQSLTVTSSVPEESEETLEQLTKPESKKLKKKVDLKKQRSLSVERPVTLEAVDKLSVPETEKDLASSSVDSETPLAVTTVESIESTSQLDIELPDHKTITQSISETVYHSYQVSTSTADSAASDLIQVTPTTLIAQIDLAQAEAASGVISTLIESEKHFETDEAKLKSIQPEITSDLVTASIGIDVPVESEQNLAEDIKPETKKIRPKKPIVSTRSASIERPETLEREGSLPIKPARREKLTKKNTLTKQRSISIERPIIFEAAMPTEIQAEVRVMPKDTLVDAPATYSTTISQQSTLEAESPFQHSPTMESGQALEAIESLTHAVSIVENDLIHSETPLDTPAEQSYSASIETPNEIRVAESTVDQIVEREGEVLIDAPNVRKLKITSTSSTQQSLTVTKKDSFEREGVLEMEQSETAVSKLEAMLPQTVATIDFKQLLESEKLTALSDDSKTESIVPKLSDELNKTITVQETEATETESALPTSFDSSALQPKVEFTLNQSIVVTDSVPGESEFALSKMVQPESKKLKKKIDLKKQRSLSIERPITMEATGELLITEITNDQALTSIDSEIPLAISSDQPIENVAILELEIPDKKQTVQSISESVYHSYEVSTSTVDQSTIELPQSIPSASRAHVDSGSSELEIKLASIENKETLEKEGQFEVPKPRREKLTKKTSITKQRSISIERPVIMEMETPTEVQPEIRVTPKDTVVESPSTYSTTISQQSTYEAETIFDGVEVKPRIADQSIESIGQAISVVTSDVSQDEVPLETPQETLQSASIGLPTMTIAESRVDQVVEKEGDMIIDEETSKPKTKKIKAKPPIKSKQSLIVAQKDTFEKEGDLKEDTIEISSHKIDITTQLVVTVASNQVFEREQLTLPIDQHTESIVPKLETDVKQQIIVQETQPIESGQDIDSQETPSAKPKVDFTPSQSITVTSSVPEESEETLQQSTKPESKRLKKKVDLKKQRSISIERPVTMESETKLETSDTKDIASKSIDSETPLSISTIQSIESTVKLDIDQPDAKTINQSISESVHHSLQVSTATADVAPDSLDQTIPTPSKAIVGLTETEAASGHISTTIESEKDLEVNKETKPETIKPSISDTQAITIGIDVLVENEEQLSDQAKPEKKKIKPKSL
ncbi:LOW QUALITY PROTEIN: titin-like [Panonychus citri]|uniref:LOW QUALITY PROTEIN: titin-like n=1 Tax=Panonychus citri TaxID=50023 RepID=UPI002306F500|nr:LOW QUALITY PROTEIN: titin-like [Panonychus citri]